MWDPPASYMKRMPSGSHKAALSAFMHQTGIIQGSLRPLSHKLLQFSQGSKTPKTDENRNCLHQFPHQSSVQFTSGYYMSILDCYYNIVHSHDALLSPNMH